MYANKSTDVVPFLSKQKIIILLLLIVLILIMMLLCAFVLLSSRCLNLLHDKHNTSLTEDEKHLKMIHSDLSNKTLEHKMRIISRFDWLAQPPVQTPNELETPVPYVIIWHTTTENCSDQASCTFHVRFIQNFHIDSRQWWDIAYNFLVGGDGNAYEGRGWKREGSHTFDYNKKSIGIAFIGTFINIKPPEWQLNACKVLIDIGVKKGFIREDYKLLAARQLTGTQAPGDLLYEELKTWPHWVKKP